MSVKLFSCLFVLSLAAIACEGDSRFFRNPNYRDLYYRNQFYGGLANANPNPNPDPFPIPIETAERKARKVEEIPDDSNDEIDDTEDDILGQEKGLSEAISTLSGSGKGRNDPNVLRPLIVSLRTTLRQIARSQNENQEILKSILSVQDDTLAWEKTQATRFYTLISGFAPSY
ncbi:hypothetical protein KR059_007068 [Drosophila kikkawai]|nr:hypothetical protein KR059_007068 [Drosophila kikkawai]